MAEAPKVLDEKVLFQNIIARIPLITDPGQMRELVTLAIDMALRRAEDLDLRKQLEQRVDDLFAVPAPDYSVASIELLLAAREHRLPRQVVHQPARREAVDEAEDQEAAAAPDPGRRRRRLAVMAAAAAVAAVLAVGGAFQLWTADRPVPSAAVEPAAVAQPDLLSLAVDAAKGVTQPVKMPGVRLYVLHGADGASFVRAEGVPARACAAAGLDLARLGSLTVDGRTPKRLSRIGMGELCRHSRAPLTITWRPTEQEKTEPMPTPTGE